MWCLGIREVEDKKVIQPLKAVIRIATPEDDETGTQETRREGKRSLSDLSGKDCKTQAGNETD